MSEREVPGNDPNCIINPTEGDVEFLRMEVEQQATRVFADVAVTLDVFRDAMDMNSQLHSPETDLFYYHSDHLGSASWITDGQGAPMQHLQYCPYGEPFVDEHVNSAAFLASRYTFSGKERDEETGYSNFGARYLDATLLTSWFSVDPMADKYPSLSPYAYCAWNPIKLVDPDGREHSPIYDENGNFLGTDDQGLRGDAIMMDSRSFKQGMSHRDAVKNGVVLSGLLNYSTPVWKEYNPEVLNKIYNHYMNLIKRPDYDGFVTRKEGIAWVLNHKDALSNRSADNALYIDASKIDFGNYTITKNKGDEIDINLLNGKNLINSVSNSQLRHSVYALGRISVKIIDEKNKAVQIINNTAAIYNWDKGGGFLRSNLIKIETYLQKIPEDAGCMVYYYGIGHL